MTLNIRAHKPLTKALAQLEPVNETLEDKTLHITSILDKRRKGNGIITLGETVYVAGWTFLIDTSRDDENVWLENDNGEKILRARVRTSTATTIDFIFEGEAAPGEYRIAIYTRLGDSSRPVQPSLGEKSKSSQTDTVRRDTWGV